MRLYEFETPKRVCKRRETIPLKTINKMKKAMARELAAEEARAPLLAAMYGRPIDSEATHTARVHALELEQEKIELAKDKAELANIQAEQGEDTFKAIQRLSRSAMRQRKNTP